MNETAVCIGSPDMLVGVYSEPVVATGDDIPVLVLVSPGIVHRSGPFRMHVEIARRLASLGYPCFRFDLAGIGDSACRSDEISEQEGTERDVRLAMDYLQRRFGKRRFLLFGLCSAADISHQVAVADPRVAGLITLDGFAYPKLGYFVRRLGRLAGNPGFAFRRTLGLLRSSGPGRALLGPPPEGRKAEPVRVFERYLPPQEQVAAQMQTLADRGMHALYGFTGGCAWYNHAGQFFRNFPNLRRNPQVDVEYFVDADHTFMMLGDRTRLVDRVATWVVSRFPQRVPRMTSPDWRLPEQPAQCAAETVSV